MTDKYEQLGYRVVGLVVREQRKRKRVNGRARGFYEGVYVYVRVVQPDGKKRDIYLGRPGEARKPGRPARVEKILLQRGPRATSPAKIFEWRKGGEKRLADTRDPYDTQTRSMFPVETRGHKSR